MCGSRDQGSKQGCQDEVYRFVKLYDCHYCGQLLSVLLRVSVMTLNMDEMPHV